MRVRGAGSLQALGTGRQGGPAGRQARRQAGGSVQGRRADFLIACDPKMAPGSVGRRHRSSGRVSRRPPPHFPGEPTDAHCSTIRRPCKCAARARQPRLNARARVAMHGGGDAHPAAGACPGLLQPQVAPPYQPQALRPSEQVRRPAAMARAVAAGGKPACTRLQQRRGDCSSGPGAWGAAQATMR